MAHALADETLAVILSLVLAVHDEDFASLAPTSPFALRQFSTADTLLVCKRWMRVATPLLYDTVILRSTAQAQALAKALKKNPAFGVYLKRLRIEGGFGASVGKSMLAAKGLMDLWLMLDLTPRDNTKSMCEALPSLRPRRLTCYLRTYSPNAPARALIAALQSSFPLWTELRSLTFTVTALCSLSFSAAVRCCSSSLEELIVVEFRAYPLSLLNLRTLMEELPSLRCVRLHTDEDSDSYSYSFRAHLSKIVAVNPRNSSPTAPMFRTSLPRALDPNVPSNPMHIFPDSVQHRIWTRILSNVLFSDLPSDAYEARRFNAYGERGCLSVPFEQQQILFVPKALTYMFVCKLFKDITAVLASRAVSLGCQDSFDAFAALMDQNPLLYAAVHGLCLLWTPSDERLRLFLRFFGGLRRFACTVSVEGSSLQLLAGAAGLEQLELISLRASAGTSMILWFPQLRRLRVDTLHGDAGAMPHWHLPQLVELHIVDDNRTLAESLRRVWMPYLKFISVSNTALLATHGLICAVLRLRHTAVDVALPFCPFIHTLHLHRNADLSRFESLAAPHTSLAKIYLPAYYGHYHRRGGGDENEPWKAFFDFLARDRAPDAGAPSKLPALSELVVVGFSWPTSPQDIAQSKMGKWSEAMQALGIKMYDVNGTLWRPRLRTRK